MFIEKGKAGILKLGNSWKLKLLWVNSRLIPIEMQGLTENFGHTIGAARTFQLRPH